MEVTIGAQPCTSVVITDNTTLGELTCVAPPGPGFGAVQLRVTVDGSGTGSIRFAYDAPVVTRVLGSPCDAAAVCSIQVRASVHTMLTRGPPQPAQCRQHLLWGADLWRPRERVVSTLSPLHPLPPPPLPLSDRGGQPGVTKHPGRA